MQLKLSMSIYTSTSGKWLMKIHTTTETCEEGDVRLSSPLGAMLKPYHQVKRSLSGPYVKRMMSEAF